MEQSTADPTLRNAVLNIAQSISRLASAMGNAFPPTSRGSVTLASSAATVVPNTNVTAASKVVLFATNAAAAALAGSARAPYISALTAGSGFTVSTANATAAAGTETFNYVVFPT